MTMRVAGTGLNRATLALCLSVATATVLVWVLSVSPVWGHGGGEPFLSDVEAGPYSLYVWLDPLPAQTGELHVTVSVNLPTANGSEPVTGLPVLMRARHPDGWTIEAEATHENALNKLFYEGRLDLKQEGTWTVELLLGDAPDQVAHAFDVDVAARPSGWQAFLNWFRALFNRS